MPNKNIKKRKRVIMTSDVVPAGWREDLVAPGATDGDAATAEASETFPAENAHADEASVASKNEESSTADTTALSDIAVPNGALEAITEQEASEAVGGTSNSEDASISEGGSAPGEVTEPAARGDELWTPEESEPPAATVPAADLSRAHLKGLIEALVFVADQPLAIGDIAKAAGRADRKLVKALADELRQDYARRGVHLDEVAGGLIFRTNPAYAPFIRDAAAKRPVRMTRAQLETLAIIAYRQPLTRPEVDDVRGVDSGAVMKMLLERDLIKILGKKDEPGRPLLYGTTHVFLEFFGLKALKDLPSLREFTELSDDSRRVYDREMGDSPDAPTDPDLATLAAAASAVGTADRGETSDPTDTDPRTTRPAEDAQGDWFERPTEPDTSLDALDSPRADPESEEEEESTTPGSDTGESGAQA
jgi:segregation and condensation protein B